MSRISQATVLATALLFAANAARADCDFDTTGSYAVQFKLNDILGSWQQYEYFSLAQLGEAHWKVRKIAEWAGTLQPGCVREHYMRYLSVYLSMIEDNANRLKANHRTQADPHEADEQAAGHILSDHIPVPPARLSR